ncbi:TonB-dependent receptor [Novosphingobium umbonatum]|uniref:TonB-dependent receptor n=1 Tax=Novosphingobium umbonatum TaxID=1908524 RepID=A0A3S2UUW3_9SPHN|nr:TonB-dependent receptor [Novosphingobium umbonatum]RVU05653.1 TonB-dependent receptor [Novosphingobium umbonatum]
MTSYTHAMRLSLYAATALTVIGTAQAQTATAAASQVNDVPANEIVVTGLRASLKSATMAKQAMVGFGDAIYAEDIGKLPATNLAETLNRMPGVRLNRDINGEGTQVAIRGLGPSFSKVLLNNTQIAVASDGGTTGGSANREVDLDLFPSELFTKLELSKSPLASQLEGGTAGVVNLRNARPFDKRGTHVTAIAQGQYTDTDFSVSPRGSLIASKTWDTFGILVGVSGVRQSTRIDGFETVGWTDGNLGSANGDVGTGNGFQYASVMPNNVGHGYTAGSTVNLAQTSGLPLSTLGSAIIPRLGRNSLTSGTRSRISSLVSLEWRPSDTLQFALDAMYAVSKRDYTRSSMNWYVRNSGPGTSPTSTGGMVPIGLTVDSNNIVTNGTFANSSFFNEYAIFKQTTRFYNINPNVMWKPADKLKVEAQVNFGHSTFFREQPAFNFQTTPQSGVDVYYSNPTGALQPVITTNVNLADPNAGWRWYRVTVQNVRRTTDTKGAHLDLSWGDSKLMLRAGAAWDRATRQIIAYDNSAAFQTSVCGSTCAGTTGSVLNSQVSQYLLGSAVNNFGHLSSSNVGYTGWITPNLTSLMAATNYAYYRDTAPQALGAVTGGSTGNIKESTFGGYVSGDGVFDLFGRELKANAGLRYYRTQQGVAGPVQIGSTISYVNFNKTYSGLLPSANFVYDVASKTKLRFALSKTITRADASSLMPGLTFSDPSAQTASRGNPDLRPYKANNIDLGGEYYTGGIGYVGLSLFYKNIDGFTTNQQTTLPFTALGIPYSSLTVTQQQAIDGRGGASAATVTVTQPVNLQSLNLKGLEATWVQPLDFLIKGTGFSANVTHIKQSSSSGLVATGISPWSYNLQGFYEGHGVSFSLNYVWNDGAIAANGPQNNIAVPLKSVARGQLDMSTSYALPILGGKVKATVDVLNITNQPIRTVFGYDNATYSIYWPGRQILFGLRGSF